MFRVKGSSQRSLDLNDPWSLPLQTRHPAMRPDPKESLQLAALVQVPPLGGSNKSQWLASGNGERWQPGVGSDRSAVLTLVAQAFSLALTTSSNGALGLGSQPFFFPSFLGLTVILRCGSVLSWPSLCLGPQAGPVKDLRLDSW